MAWTPAQRCCFLFSVCTLIVFVDNFFYLGGQSVSCNCKASLAALRLYGYFCDFCLLLSENKYDDDDDCCTPIPDVASRRHLRSASRRQLLVTRHNLTKYGRRAFSVAGPAAWNCMCDELREPLLTANSFRQLLETRLFAEY